MKQGLGRFIKVAFFATAGLNSILWIVLAFQLNWLCILGWPIGGGIISLVACAANYVIFGEFTLTPKQTSQQIQALGR